MITNSSQRGAGALLFGLVAMIAASTPAFAVTQAPAGWRTLGYRGATFDVPDAWPVYNLAADPSRCVRFEVHAVYLGATGPQPACPAGLVGRADGLQVQPLADAPQVEVARAVVPATLNGEAARIDPGGATLGATVVVLPRPGLLISVFRGPATSVADRVLGSFRTAAATAPGRTTPAADASAGTGRPPASALRPASTPGVPSATANTAIPVASVVTGPGFDACTAPSLPTMAAWLASPYRSIGVYIGGINRACDQANLSASWISSVEGEGWHPVPTYVGRQAPCSTGTVPIDPATAAAEGRSAADDAVAQAAAFGLGVGSPIYFDMEAYDINQPSCSQTVLTFLDGWTAEIHVNGYISGVYGSSGSTITDLEKEVGISTFHLPDDIWFADWNGVAGVFGDPYIPDSLWAPNQRLHQYQGGHDETWGGQTINIDLNYDKGLISGAATLSSVPLGVTAIPGNGSAKVSWTAPSDGGSPITAYTVTASPGGAIATVAGTSTSTTITGLANRVAYTFTVRATNGVGQGPISTPSNAVLPELPSAGAFFPVVPARILDTRIGIGAPAAPIPSAGTITVPVTGRGGVPSSGVAAVVLHVTATNATLPTFLTLWPAGFGRPGTSNVNSLPGQNAPNLVVSLVGAGGAVSIWNAQGATDAVADVVGWYSDGTSGPGSQFVGITPTRVLDTRFGIGAPAASLGTGGMLNLTVAGVGGVPSSGVTAVVFNLTATNTAHPTWLTVWPTGKPFPTTASLNVAQGQTISNLVMAAVGAGNQVSIWNQAGPVDVVADVVGYYTTQSGDHFHPLVPVRMLDTRDGTGIGTAGPIGAGATIGFQISGTPNIPPGATAAVLNVTTVNATQWSFVTIYPSDIAQPGTSNLNFVRGQVMPNLAVARLSGGGRVSIYNFQGTVEVVADAVGWFSPA
jgi:Domain of unknown function (DUF1906)/Fibronectin type III domain